MKILINNYIERGVKLIMANEGRLSLTPLPKNKDQLARIGELLSDQDEGVLYTKLTDGSIVPVKGDSYFRLLNFYNEFWNIGEDEPSDSPSQSWINENEYDEDMEDLNAVLMIKDENENGDLIWKAVSLHSKADSILIDEDTSKTLDDFVNKHEEFYDRIFDLSGEEPSAQNPDVKKHWIKKEGISSSDEVVSGAIMVKSDNINNDYLAISPTVLDKDVIVDLEKGHTLRSIIPDLYDMKDIFDLVSELEDDIRSISELKERVSQNEAGISHAIRFTKDEIADLRDEILNLINPVPVVNQYFVSDYDTFVSLPNISEVIIDSEEVTSIDGETTYDKGTDYEINYGDGNIKVLSSGNMEDNKMYYIDLKYVKKINLGDYYGSGSKDNTNTVQSFGMWGEL
jgi:hypothetical protein